MKYMLLINTPDTDGSGTGDCDEVAFEEWGPSTRPSRTPGSTSPVRRWPT
ncbi:hypothetical protein ACFQYP_28785 [Nonomuraea antimicrobica]